MRLLGAGGMGEVFLAHDPRLDRHVAIKRLISSKDATPERQERFRREAKIAARLNHPAVVQIYDVVEHEGSECIVMEFVEGTDLRTSLKGKPLAVRQFLRLALQIAHGMAAAHDVGIIHRDLKTENVLLTRSGHIKITDFGIAKMLGEETLTAEGVLIGTCRAMSPEQVLGKPLDRRSDMFSFGILAYEALTGVSPFVSETQFVTMQRIAGDEHPPITEEIHDIPPELAALIDQCLAKEPALRPRDFHDIAEALADILRDGDGHGCNGNGNGPLPDGHPPVLLDDPDTAPGDIDPHGETHAAQVTVPASPRGMLETPGGPRLQSQLTQPLVEASGDADVRRAPYDAGSHMTPDRADQATDSEAADSEAVDSEATDSEAAISEPTDGVSQTIESIETARPRSRARARLGVAITLSLPLLLGLTFWLWPDDVSIPRVAVMPPEFDIRSPEDEELLRTVHMELRSAVLQLDGLELIPDAEIRPRIAADARPTPAQLADALGADEVISSHLDCSTAVECTLHVERIDADSKTLEQSHIQLLTDTLLLSDTAITTRVHGDLYPTKNPLGLAGERAVEERSYREFRTLRKRYWERPDGVSVHEILDDLKALRKTTRGFIDVYYLESKIRLGLFVQTRDPTHLDATRDLVDQAAELDPRSLLQRSLRFEIALATREHDDARQILDDQERHDPDGPWTRFLRGRWLMTQAQYEDARVQLEMAEKSPHISWRSLYYLCLLAVEQRDHDAARQYAERFKKKYPRNREYEALIGLIETRLGRPACVVEALEPLVANRKTYTECLRLSLAQSALDRHEDAAKSMQCVLDIRPNQLDTLVDVAESWRRAGKEQEAEVRFRRALRQLDGLPENERRTYRAYEALALAHLSHAGHGDEQSARRARELVDELRREGVSSGLYNMSTVYALLGDHTTAAKLSRQVLDDGRSAHSFRYSWFEPMRRDPELPELLRIEPPEPTCP